MKFPASFLLLLFAICIPLPVQPQSEGASFNAETSAAHPTDAERIQTLEARVAELERIVKTLTQAREASSGTPANASEAAASPTSKSTPSEAAAAFAATESTQPTPVEIAKAQSQELLPSLGRIGAVAFLDGGINSGPFTLHRGSHFGGGLSLPIAIVPRGRLNYEVSVGLAQNSRRLPITSNVAQFINLSILNAVYPNQGISNIEQALTGTGSAPFSVTVPADWRAQTLQVAPLTFRYDFTGWDRYHLRPYGVAGLGTYVTISNQVTTSALRENANLPPAVLSLLESYFGPNSPLSGALLGGQIATAAELKANGIPTGQGGVDAGMIFGGGLEWRLGPAFSIAIDDRYNYAPSGTAYNLAITRLGWHF
jgi:hypothetical protein